MLALLVLFLLLLFSSFCSDSLIGDVPWGRKDLVGSSLMGDVVAFCFDGLKLDELHQGDNIFFVPPLAVPSCVFPLLWVDCDGMLPLIPLPSGMKPRVSNSVALLSLFRFLFLLLSTQVSLSSQFGMVKYSYTNEFVWFVSAKGNS
jgi:hypothetical protein